eukprot:TRINITY_DN3461_c0_g1_i2.p1 TRINITY_DN3461_c0_g1~~TRINITY_DN3461_c0_g1_i2.p1  ORF type:complete len:261 (+),score=69.87 TRINITY_DN3461_c0_g1_i2:203-985(+)
MAHAAALRQAMRSSCVALPGAFSGLVGRMAADMSFQGVYVSGAAVTASLGQPDIGVASMEQFTKIIREISVCSGLPIIADADTGFGEEEMVTKTVYEYWHAGASGMHIEDQVFPKRCGHLDGKSLVPVEQFAQKVQRAAAARDACSDGQFIVCARTDARSVEGLDAVVERAKVYVDSGADMIFPEGLHTAEEFQYVADALKGYGGAKNAAACGGPYLLANMTEFGKTPIINHAEFERMGYHCVIYPVLSLIHISEPTRPY